MVTSASRVGSINVLLQTDIRGGVAGLNSFAATVEKTGVSASRSVAGIDRSVGSLNRTLGGIGQHTRGLTSLTVSALRTNSELERLRRLALASGVAVGGLVPAAIVSSLIRTADGAHRLSNQLRTVTTDTSDLRNTQDALFQVAQRTRSAFDSTVTIYARTARATEHLSLSQEKLLRLTETVQKSFAIGGASAAEAQGAAIQLSQGIASNRFSGEEFRSVSENAPVLLRGMADSLGVNIGKLREMAHAGQLTADVVTKAIIDASQRIDEEFAKTTSTIEQAWQKVSNAVLKYAMDSENASVASGSLVSVLNALSANIDTTADALFLLGGAVASVFAGRAASSGVAGMKDYVAGLQASRREALATAEATKRIAKAEALAAATRAREARQAVIGVSRGRDDELRTVRGDMLRANAEKVAAAEQKLADAAVKTGEASAAADAKAAAAKQNATEKWSHFTAVAKQEKKEIVDSARASLAAAEAQKVSTQSHLAGAKAHYEMTKASTVSQKTQERSGRQLQAALKADLQATNTVALAQTNLQSALDGNTKKSRAYLAAQKAADVAKAQAISTSTASAAAEAKHTQAVAAHAAAQKATQAAIASGNLTKQQEAALNQRSEALERKVAAAKVVSASATLAARDAALARAAAETRLLEAQRSSTLSAVAFSAAGRAVSSAWAFIGGPFGAALLAVGAAMYVVSSRTQEAEARADRYAEAISRAKDETDKTAGSLRRVAEEFFKVANGAGTAESIVAQRQALSDLSATTANLVETYLAAGRGLINIGTFFSEGYQQIGELVTAFKNGEISAEEFRAALNRIASTNPDLAPVIVDLQRLGDQADAERGRIDALTESLQRLSLAWARGMETIAGFSDGGVGEKGDRLTQHLSNDQFNSRFGQPFSKNWEELFPDLFKKEKQGKAPKKTADDRFDNSLQALQDRMAALRLERELLGATYFEQVRREEALKLEQEALKQAREEARKKGEADWQSAQISDEKRAKIEEVSAALAAEADATRRATEAIELQRDILNGVFGDLRSALADGKITTEEWGDVFINVLDKIIDKIQTDLVDALVGLNSTGGGGILGALGKLLGLGGGGGFNPSPTGFMDMLTMDSGGTVLGGNVIPFGPKTKRLGTGVLADSGLGPRHYPAILEEGERVLDKAMGGRTDDFISGAIQEMKDGGPVGGRITLHVVGEEGPMFRPVIRAESQGVAVKVVQASGKARQKNWQNGGSPK